MDPREFREHGRAVIDRIADYLAHPENVAVLPAIEPGTVRDALPAAAPEKPEPFDRILADFDRIIVPNTTHWNHPGFFAYFAVTGSAPGILAEALIAALNVNAMLWRSGPAQTELEEVTLGWLRKLLGLPDDFHGVINDTASSSTLYALAAAREAADLGIREHGMTGRDLPVLRIYCSEEAHSSVDKAAIALGIGAENVVRLPSDDAFRLPPDLLRRHVRADRARGFRPLAVVATVGTTGVTAVDPVPAIADVCRDEGLWLHVDAAYGGMAAILPELRHVLDGCDLADSLVVNPHKWMFTPIDCSAAYTRHPDIMRRAFSLTPEYLKTAEADRVTNLMDYGVSLGRRFRALKLWFVLRWFGREGIADAIREHVRLARLFAGWVDDDPRFTRVAPTDLSVVAFRCAPPGETDGDRLDALNEAILRRVNASGEVFLSHTKVRGRHTIRLAIGNLRTREAHVRRAWELLRDAAAAELEA